MVKLLPGRDAPRATLSTRRRSVEYDWALAAVFFAARKVTSSVFAYMFAHTDAKEQVETCIRTHRAPDTHAQQRRQTKSPCRTPLAVH